MTRAGSGASELQPRFLMGMSRILLGTRPHSQSLDRPRTWSGNQYGFRGPGRTIVVSGCCGSEGPMHASEDRCRRDDADLVVAAQAGDLGALTELVRRHEMGTRAVARALLGREQDVEDATQEAFVRAIRQIHSLGSPHRFGPWVRQIARNTARNMRDRRRSVVSIEQATVAAPASDIELAERVAATIQALSRLTPPVREATRLAYLVGHRQRDVASRLKVPVGTVKSRLATGRRLIREGVNDMTAGSPVNLVPLIRVEDRPGESMCVPVRGYGMVFGSVLEVGDVEVMRFYDYPGGVLTSTDRTEVLRRVELCGRECFEVLTTSVDCDPPEPNVLNYFEVRDDAIAWLLRVWADPVRPRVSPEVITEPTEPRHYDSATIEPPNTARVVNLYVGDIDRGRCLAVMQVGGDGTAAEMFYNREGRQVLHRRFVGPEATYGDYRHLSGEPVRPIQGKDYRHWYDTVLHEP